MATANRRDKSIDYDAGFIKISSAIAMFICKKLIFPGVRVKLQLYGFLIICLSIIRALDMAPISSFFSNRRNFLNLIFVKFGWGWMLTLCMPFVLLTHSCDQNGSRFNIYNIMLPTFRLVIATFIWKLVTGFFTYFEVIFGARCILNRNYLVANNKFECKQHGGYWMPFIDLSGHIFLLSYTCFIMSEEAIAIDRWLTLGTALGKQYEQHELGDHNNNSDRINTYKSLNPYVRFFYFSQAVLMLIYEVMLVSTSLYFHNLFHKLIAYVISVGAWYVTYNIYFQSKILISPGSPR